MDNLSGPSDPRDQGAVAKPKPADDSGPGDPRDDSAPVGMDAEGSGPGDPRDQADTQTEVTITSGPGDPRDGSDSNAPGGMNALLEKTSPGNTAQRVSLRTSIRRPHPFSVYISSPAGHAVKVEALEVHIWKNGSPVFTTVLSTGTPINLASDACNVFPFTEKQLSDLLPHLLRGTTVKVDLSYSAPSGSKVTIGIIGKDFHDKLGTFIERLLHSDQ